MALHSNNNRLQTTCVIIVAWNQVEKTLDCLQSVYAQTDGMFDVVLVDNGSEAALGQAVAEQFPQVTLMRNDHNLGFAGGYNVGIEYALDKGYDFLCLLNNDVLLEAHCLVALVDYLESHPDAGLATAKIYYAHDPARIWTVGAWFRPWLLELRGDAQGEIDDGRWEIPHQIEFAPFCGVLIRRHVFETVGMLDDQFFVYYEDMDYCQRMKQAGLKLFLVPQAKIWHVVSASSGGRGSPRERFWMGQSSGRYFRKHGRGWRISFIVPYRLGSGIRISWGLLINRQWDSLGAYWWGLATGWSTGKANVQPPNWV